MKPGFALLFNDNGLELLRRAKAGWQSIGTAALDDDLATNLTFLRRTATEIAGPAGLASKLVLPRDQILVTTQTISDPSGDVPAQIKTLLVGMTPYAVDDLRFDWRMAGDQVQIAAIATETLEEAEQFALDNGLNPLSFAAEPLGDDFDGEANFGTTKAADTILKGAVFAPDQEPTVATTAYVPPPADAKTEPASTDKTPDAEPKAEVVPVSSGTPHDAAPEPSGSADDTPKDTDTTPHSEAMIAGVTVDTKPAPPADTGPSLSFQTTRSTPPTPSTGQSGLDQVVSRVTPTLKADDPAPSQDAIKSLSFTVPTPPETPKPAPTPIAPATPAPKPVTPVIVDTPPKPEQPQIEEPSAPVEPAVAASPGFTVFGARKRKETPPARARLGLLMTASLIILMVLIAILYRPSSDDVEQVDITPTVPAVDAPLVATVPEAADLIPEAAPLTPQVFTLEQAEAAYAQTGIWQRAAVVPTRPATDDLDDIFIASIDPNISATDAIALPAIPEPTIAFVAPINPAPAGQNFDIGSNGIIVATPEGITTPEGARVFAGGATSRPLARPASILPPEVSEDAAVVVSSQSDIRPTPRPNDIAERIEQATQNGPSRSELAGARPQPRPEALIARVLAEAEERAAAQANATAQAQADAEAKARVEAALAAAAEADLTPEVTGTELALASVAPPPRRPNDIADTAKKLAESTTVTPATRQATVTTPSIPSRSSVTQAATVSNVIPLRKVAVIGIFGSSSNRSALIRAANGRTSTVKVGDRVDGGRVTAISETEVRYVKGSRNLVLAMPKS